MDHSAHYVIAAAAVASHNVKHAWVLAGVASRFAASSCALRFSHFANVLLFSWTKFFTKAKSWCLFRCTSRAIRYTSISVYRLPLSSGPLLKKCLRSRTITVMVNENTRVCSLRFENGKKTSPFDWLPILPFQKKKKKKKKKTHVFLKWLASLVSDREKRNLTYAETMEWLRCHLAFALVRASVLCLRGTRVKDRPVTCPIVALAEAQVDLKANTWRSSNTEIISVWLFTGCWSHIMWKCPSFWHLWHLLSLLY